MVAPTDPNDPNEITACVLDEVSAERARQRAKGFDARWDGKITPDDWHNNIAAYLGWARCMLGMGSPLKARRRMIQVAAMAVANIESLDRRLGPGHLERFIGDIKS